MARRIPIRNLYDLLCYAWDVLEERDDTLVSELEGLSHVELLAKVLSVSVQRLWKRGLDRGYGTIGDDVRSPRGRLDVPRMVARQLEPLGLAACSFDALGHDVLHNQILATTARRLARLPQLHRELRDAMIAIGRTLADVSTIPVRSSTFSQVQLHGRLCRYRLPLHVCQLIHDQLVVDEVTGEVRFRDYVEDERRMAVLFEEFVCNFYRRELHGWKIRGSEKIAWDLVPLTPDAGRYVPEMRTDIVLRGAGRTVLIDTKFYAEAFVSRFENDKLRSAHLYQITTYLRSLAAATAGADASAAGVLLYPEVRPLPTLQFQHGPHRLTATGVDLTQGWREIHQRLLDIVASA